jgi:hypothetical protein
VTRFVLVIAFYGFLGLIFNAVVFTILWLLGFGHLVDVLTQSNFGIMVLPTILWALLLCVWLVRIVRYVSESGDPAA